MALIITGCNGSGGNGSSNSPETQDQKQNTVNIKELDVTGTWLIREEKSSFNKENDDYLVTNVYESKIILNDTVNGVEFSNCERYGLTRPDTGVKSDERLYLRFDNNGYEYDNGDFVRSWEEDDYYLDNITWQITVRLIKLSDEVELDSGSLTLTSPLEISEQNHVCISYSYSSLSTDRSIGITIPHNEDEISFDIGFWGEMETKSYEYDASSYSNQISSISLRSYDDIFYNSTGEYYPYLATGNINFTTVSENSISGEFSTTSEAGYEYSGSFEAIF